MLGLFAPELAHAHSLSFGVLRVIERAGGARVVLRAGGREGSPPPITLEIGGSCTLRTPSAPWLEDGVLVLQGALECPSGLDGARVRVHGIDDELSLAARVERLDGTIQTALLDARNPELVVAPPPSGLEVLLRYTALGTEHIVLGLDHLLFVLALLLVVLDPRVPRPRPIRHVLFTVSGFTAGHSVTLSLAALGALALPAEPVEVCIALSIVLLAAELLRPGAHAGTSFHQPWLVAAAFGLLHGLGFASALSEHGLPEGQRALGLAGFNLGVELGQLAFVALAMVLLAMVRPRVRWAPRAMAGAVGAAGAMWLGARLESFFSGL